MHNPATKKRKEAEHFSTKLCLDGVDRPMSEEEVLKLADTMSIVQAACCILGISTSLAESRNDNTEALLSLPYNPEDEDEPALPNTQFQALISILKNAAIAGKLQKARKTQTGTDKELDSVLGTNRNMFLKENETFSYNLWGMLIDVDELKHWLISRNCKPPFFFGAEPSSTPDYLNQNHPRFSPELAAAVKAWQAMNDAELYSGKSSKQAIMDWAESNYQKLGLMHQNKKSTSAINRVSQVANWEKDGGAPKTPE